MEAMAEGAAPSLPDLVLSLQQPNPSPSNIQFSPPLRFLSRTHFSLSSATSATFNDEHNSKGTIEMVEEKMKDCFIKNKRLKRQLSPSAAPMAEERRLHRDNRFGATAKGFDPSVERLRALDLISQFHA